MADRTEKIRELAKKKSINRQNEILKVIYKMRQTGRKITFYGISKLTGASKSYLYNNKAIAKAIREGRDASPAPRSEQSKQTIITAQRLKIRKLQKRIKELEETNDDNYKAKYEKLLVENSQLKEQLKNAYTIQ